MSSKVLVDVEGRQVALTNLEKVLYPEVGFTKGQVLDYYTRIAPVLLPHLAGRPVTFTRWPDGIEGQTFFEPYPAELVRLEPQRKRGRDVLERA